MNIYIFVHVILYVSFIRLTYRSGLGNRKMAASLWRGQESSSCPVHGVGCHSSPSLRLWSWRIPREPLDHTGILKKRFWYWKEECRSNRLDELAGESESQQAKGKVSFCFLLSGRHRQRGFSCFRWSEQESEWPGACALVVCRCSQAGNGDSN